MTIELGHVFQFFTLALAALALVLGILTRRSGDASNLVQRVTDLHERVALIEARSGPWWAVSERRLAEILHQPHGHPMDPYLEKIANHGVDSLTDQELFTTVATVTQWQQEVSRGGPRENPMQCLEATLMLAALHGRVSEREYLRQKKLQQESQQAKKMLTLWQQIRRVLQQWLQGRWWTR